MLVFRTVHQQRLHLGKECEMNTKTVAGVLGGLAAVLILLIGLLSGYFPYDFPEPRLHDKIIGMHTHPNRMPRDAGQMPFLYMSWFYRNSAEGGEDYALYRDGNALSHRINNGGVQSRSGSRPDIQTFARLRPLPSLPAGLAGPNAVPANRLLILSLRQGASWKTYYYDRQSLPPPVQVITQAAETPKLL